jgi:hypothetical protein
MQEVRSPVCRQGSRVGSDQPMSPGARSGPNARRDSAPPQTKQATVKDGVLKILHKDAGPRQPAE